MSWASFYVLVHIFICFKFEMSYIFTQILFYSLYEKNIGPYYFNYVFSYTVAIMHIKKKEKTSINTTDEFLSSPLLYLPKPITYMLGHTLLQSLCTQSVTLKAQHRSLALQCYSHPDWVNQRESCSPPCSSPYFCQRTRKNRTAHLRKNSS